MSCVTSVVSAGDYCTDPGYTVAEGPTVFAGVAVGSLGACNLVDAC